MIFATPAENAEVSPFMQFFSEWGLMILLLVLIVFMFWTSRRRAQRMKTEQEAKAKAMLPGVKVLLQGGFYGVLTEYDGEDLSKPARVALAPGLEVEVHSQAILRVVEDEVLTEDQFIEVEEHQAEYEADVEQGVISSVSDDQAYRREHDADADPDDRPKA